MRLFRIADSRHPLWDGQGALRLGGRFNSPDQPVVYAALTYAGAMLEILAQARIGKLPRQQVFVMAEIPDHLAIERADGSRLPPGWDQPESPSARAFGDQWLAEQRTTLLLVPSVVAREEWNAVVNLAHPEAQAIQLSKPQPVIWDQRLFNSSPSA